MGTYFNFKNLNSSPYSEKKDVKIIRTFLESIGELTDICDDQKLRDLYHEFSESQYCAGWLCLDYTGTLIEFANWLRNK